jgi:hypothetical protein
MSTYKGKRDPADRLGETTVTVDGKPLPLRLDLRNHSPTGFEWGYTGSGPAQLALAILAHHFKVPRRKKQPPIGSEPSKAERLYQDLKDLVIARLDVDEWELTSEQLEAHIAAVAEDST